MPNDPTQLVVAGNGSVRIAPVGTTAPTDIATAWGAGWIDLGLIDEDGITESPERELESIMAWQEFYPVRRIVVSADLTISFNLRQWNKTTLPLFHGGGSITATAGPPAHYRVSPPSPETLDERAMGIEWKDGTVTWRLIIPKGMVTDLGETTLNRQGSAVLPITFGIIGTGGTDPWYYRSDSAALA